MKSLFEVIRGFGQVIVKVGGSCLVDKAAYVAIARSIAWFQQQTKARVLVVVSAAYGETDKRLALAKQKFLGQPWRQARFVAQGEIASAKLLAKFLRQEQSAATQLITAREIGLVGWGGDDPFSGELLHLDADSLSRRVQAADISVIPGYYALDQLTGRRVLLGRGATDLIAVALARAWGAPCCFCKDSGAVYVLDPGLVPGRLPRQMLYLSYQQAYDCASSGHAFLMSKSVRLAEQGGVPLYIMPNPAAPNAWDVGAIVSYKPTLQGIFVGVQSAAYCSAIPCACVTVTQWGASINGQLEKVVRSCVQPIDIRTQGDQTKIFVTPSAIAPLVSVLAAELNLLEVAG